MVGVAGLEPAASWSRRFGLKFSKRFRARLVLFVTEAVALQTSPLHCLHPLPAWSGSAFGSGPGVPPIIWRSILHTGRE